MSTKPVMALSHSRLADFNQCPLKFKYKYIDKNKAFLIDDSAKSPHLVRGSNVHKALENYVIKINAGQEAIPPSSLPEVENTKPYIDSVFKSYQQVMPEQQISVDVNYKQVDWFAKNSYYRAILDLIAINPTVARIDDYKTGKFVDYTPENGYGQLHLSACIGMSVLENVEKIITSYIYVDHRQIVPVTFTRAQLPDLQRHFNEESEKVNSEVNFDPTQNKFCNFCEATKAQCPYSKKMDTSQLVFKPKA
jgi:CRISPR/Cas system-associated exonuclease Cas4 (RecB family)